MMLFFERLKLDPDAVDRAANPPAARALAQNLVTKTDLVRLKVLARLHARGLPADVDWTDLLQEAFARVLRGSRRKPEGVPMVAFLAGVMRSIKAEHWRRLRRERRDAPVDDPFDPVPDPERSAIAMQELEALDQLFADDDQARHVMDGLADGLGPDEICELHHMSTTDYQSTRRRMRRVLIRENLRSEQP